MRLSVDKGNSGDRIVVVVRVLIPALNQLLLRLFQPKRTHKALPIARYVYVGHITGVIDSRFPLKVMSTLVMMTSAPLVHIVQWLLTVTLVDRVLSPLTVQVVLACVRVQLVFV